MEHIAELGNEVPAEPVIFIKPNSSIASEIYFDKTDAIQYEAEITFLLNSGKLSGVGFGLDLTKRAVQSVLKEKGLPWERAKAFDGAAVFSEFVSFEGCVDDLTIELSINDCVVQRGQCRQMISKPECLLTEVGSFLSFENGDLLMTGTPRGVGAVKQADRFAGKIFEKQQLLVQCAWLVQPRNR